MKKQYYFIFLSLFLLTQCGNPESEKNTREEYTEIGGEINLISSDPFLSLARSWVKDFQQSHPKITVNISSGKPDEIVEALSNGKADLAMTCKKRLPENALENSWNITVMKDGVIPITSASNPYLDELMKKGIEKKKLIEIFANKAKYSWQDLLSMESGKPVNFYAMGDIYIPDKDGEDALMKVEQISDEERLNILEKIASDPYALSFCNANYAYQCMQKDTQPAVKIIPVDLNANNIIEEKEKFYDNLDDLQRAGYLGLYPDELCREMAVLAPGKPDEDQVIELINFMLNEGQKTAVEEGFSRIRNITARKIMADLRGEE